MDDAGEECGRLGQWQFRSDELQEDLEVDDELCRRQEEEFQRVGEVIRGNTARRNFLKWAKSKSL